MVTLGTIVATGTYGCIVRFFNGLSALVPANQTGCGKPSSRDGVCLGPPGVALTRTHWRRGAIAREKGRGPTGAGRKGMSETVDSLFYRGQTMKVRITHVDTAASKMLASFLVRATCDAVRNGVPRPLLT